MLDWNWIISLPQYRYGWALFGLLAVILALISGNMLIHEAGRLWRRQRDASFRGVLMNAGILLVSVAAIAKAIWEWL